MPRKIQTQNTTIKKLDPVEKTFINSGPVYGQSFGATTLCCPRAWTVMPGYKNMATGKI